MEIGLLKHMCQYLRGAAIMQCMLLSLFLVSSTSLCQAGQSKLADDTISVHSPDETVSRTVNVAPTTSLSEEESGSSPDSATLEATVDQSLKERDEAFSQTMTIYPGSKENRILVGPSLEQDKPETLSDILIHQPELHAIGTGGALTTVSVGGLGRNRIQMLINGFRVSADRRAGTDLGTVIPALIDSIRLHRGGVSLAFGSEAMGAVLDFTLAAPDSTDHKTIFSINYRDNNDYIQSAIKSRWSHGLVAIAYDDAGNYRTPDGDEVDGSFTRYNAVVSTFFPGKTWTTGLDLLFTRADDIGKPSTSSRITVYPEDELYIAGLHLQSAFLSGHLGAIHQYLKTESDGETSTIESDNLHLKALSTLQLVTLGIEFYTRQNVNATNVFDDVSVKPLKNASSYDVAPFVAMKGHISDSVIAEAGMRYELSGSRNGHFDQDNNSLGGTCSLTWHNPENVLDVSLFTSYRFPSLEEYYYTGLTARGYIEGNPGLGPEQGRGARISATRTGNRWSVGLSWQLQYVEDFITRIEIEDDYYTYINIDRARIQDLTAECTLQSFSFAFSWAEGINRDSKKTIDDIPPMKFLIGWQDHFGPWKPSFSVRHIFEQKDVGPSEQKVDPYTLVSMATTFDVNEYLSLSLQMTNLFDEEYTASADEKAITAPGRSVNFGFLLKL